MTDSTSAGTTSGQSLMDDASVEEKERCYSTINKAINKPDIAKYFAENLVPKMTLPDYPKSLTELYNSSALLLNYPPQVLKECETVCMSHKQGIIFIFTHLIWSYSQVTVEYISFLEKNTRN